MNRDEQEMALWREAYMLAMSQDADPVNESGLADAAVAEFRKRYPPQSQAPEAVWHNEPPFPKDFATRPCWIAGARRVFAGAVYWDTNEWRVYPMGVGQPYSLAGRRVSPITKPPKPTP